MSGSSIARDVRDSASRLYEPFHTKIGKKQWVYAFTLFAGPAALEGEAATRIGACLTVFSLCAERVISLSFMHAAAVLTHKVNK